MKILTFATLLLFASCCPKPYTPIDVWVDGYEYGMRTGTEMGWKYGKGQPVDEKAYVEATKKEMVKVALKYY